MTSVSSFRIGFVPTLEAIPLVSCAVRHQQWRMHPCSSYGRIIRHLLTDQLQAGLLPWELCVTELLCKPAQNAAWQIPLVIHPCPTELALSVRALNMVYPPKSSKKGRKKRLSIGLEGRFSLTRHQVLAWQSKVAPQQLESPSFKFLPMELMQKGLEADFIDGFVAPTPWGLQAACHPDIRIDPAFEPGKFAQHVVLVCTRDAAETFTRELDDLPAQLAASRQPLTEESQFRQRASEMTALGLPHCDVDQLWRASATLQPVGADRGDFKPDKAWVERQFRVLSERLPSSATHLDLNRAKAALLEPPC